MDDGDDDDLQRELEDRCKTKISLPESALLPFPKQTQPPEPEPSRKPLNPLDVNHPRAPTLDVLFKQPRPNLRQLSKTNLLFYTLLRFISVSGIILVTGLVIWWIIASAIILSARLFSPTPASLASVQLSDFLPMPVRETTPETSSSEQLNKWLEQQTDQLHLADAPLFVLYPLNSQPPTQDCTHVSGDMLNSIRIGDVKRSLLHHLSKTDYDFLCAQHLGIPLCYCIAHISSHVEFPSSENSTAISAVTTTTTQDTGLYVNLFNLNILGFSSNMVMANKELSLFCKEPIVVRRYQHVWAEFTNDDQSKHEREFRGEIAYNLQQMFEIQHAMPVCTDNYDAITTRIKRRE